MATSYIEEQWEYASWTLPTFTSNTKTEAGISYTLSASHGNPYQAFNRSQASDNCWWTNHGNTSTINACWIAIQASVPIEVSRLELRNENATPKNFRSAFYQVSDDGINWNTILGIEGSNTTNLLMGWDIPEAARRPYYRHRIWFWASYSTGGVSLQTIEFFGRQGVSCTQSTLVLPDDLVTLPVYNL